MLRIRTKTYTSQVIFTHLLIQLIILVASPSAFWLLCFLGTGRRHGGGSAVQQAALDDPSVIMFIGLGIGVVLAGVYYFKVSSRRYITGVTANRSENTFCVIFRKAYSFKSQEAEFPLDQVKIVRVNSQAAGEMLTDRRLKFYCGVTYIGEINPGGTYWNKEGALINELVNYLEEPA